MSAVIQLPTPQDDLSPAELGLYHEIMAYRADHGLPAIRLSNALTVTAGRHVVDTRENFWAEGREPPAGANYHSWSDATYWSDHSNPQAMWEAPQRLGTGYGGPGYEITAVGPRTPTDALDLWKASPAHDAILTNTGAWASQRFAAIGVGLDNSPGPGPYAGRVYHVWFGTVADAAVPDVVGTARADAFAGTAFADRLFGGAGGDRIAGAGGSDALFGQAGGDILRGGYGADRLSGGAGNDRLDGGPGNDALVGGWGWDRLFGDGGDDRLAGEGGNDALNGGAGDDRLWGGPGNDTLAGGAGRDWLVGGAGADVFQFGFPAAAGIGARRDTIADFQPGIDRIALAMDARTDLPGVQDFAFVGAGALAPGTVRYANGIVRGDVTGDGLPDFAISIAGAPALGADDFLL